MNCVTTQIVTGWKGACFTKTLGHRAILAMFGFFFSTRNSSAQYIRGARALDIQRCPPLGKRQANIGKSPRGFYYK
jgi:hypothetical protein